MSFEEAKQYLRGKDEEGASLYEHLSRLLLKIIVEKPHNANAVFEQLSQDLREITQHAPSLLTELDTCLLYTSPSPRDRTRSRMPSSA